MKKLSIVLAIALVAVAAVQASIIMDSTTLNGNFESGTGTTFNEQPSWWNGGTGNQTATAASTGLNLAGSIYNAVLSDNNLSGGTLHSAKTGYTIQTGDIFAVGFDWRDASGWEANDQVRVALVAYSGDTLAGSELWREWVSDKVTTPVTWESVTGSISDLTGAVGRTLFIQAYGVNGGGSGDFARMDNITVSTIPEPSTPLLLFGGFLGVLMALRHRKK